MPKGEYIGAKAREAMEFFARGHHKNTDKKMRDMYADYLLGKPYNAKLLSYEEFKKTQGDL